MKDDQLWIVEHFLTALQSMKFSADESPRVVSDRRKHAEMVLTELPGIDRPEMALRALAEAVLDQHFSPRDPDELSRYNRILLDSLAGALGL